jgi:hypothetical protein
MKMASNRKITRSALSLTISCRVGMGLAGPLYLMSVSFQLLDHLVAALDEHVLYVACVNIPQLVWVPDDDEVAFITHGVDGLLVFWFHLLSPWVVLVAHHVPPAG